MVIHKHNHIECELFACGTYVHTDRHTDIHTYIHTYCTCMHAYNAYVHTAVYRLGLCCGARMVCYLGVSVVIGACSPGN